MTFSETIIVNRFVAIWLIISEPNACATQYKFIVVNGQTTFAIHNVR